MVVLVLFPDWQQDVIFVVLRGSRVDNFFFNRACLSKYIPVIESITLKSSSLVVNSVVKS